MPVVDVYSLDKSKVGTVDLNDIVFDAKVNEHLFHQVVTYQLAKRRSGSANTKERNAIAGSMHKVWKQKGTGRARQGTKKAPHWVGGGVAHGPSPRDFTPKVNKKIRRTALRMALSRRQQEGALFIVDAWSVEKPKTKAISDVLGSFAAPKALIIDQANANLELSTRNLPRSNYLEASGINVYDILRHDAVIITRDAVLKIQERLEA